jgi:hypothetical protein
MNSININRNKISAAEIEKYRNFQSLVDQYVIVSKKPLPKNGWLITGIISFTVVFLSTITWFYFTQPFAKWHMDNKGPQVSSFINPPLPQWDIILLYITTLPTL